MDDKDQPATPSAEDLALGEEQNNEGDQAEDTSAGEPQGSDEDQQNDQGGSDDQGQQDDQGEDQNQGDQGSQGEEAQGEAGTNPDQPVSRRESKRIKSLLEKLAATKEQDQPLPTGKSQSQPKGQDEPIIPEGDYDLSEVNKLAQEYADKKYQEGIEEALSRANAQSSSQFALGQFYTDLKLDAPTVATKYDFMNQDSQNFDPGRTELVNTLYLQAVGYNPGNPKSNTPASIQRNDIGYAEFVDSVMELVDRTSAAQAADSQANVNQQAINTGPRPGGTARTVYQGDDPGKMSDEQLDAVIAQGLSILPSARRRTR